MQSLEGQIVDRPAERKGVVIIRDGLPAPVTDDLPNVSQVIAHHVAVARRGDGVDPQQRGDRNSNDTKQCALPQRVGVSRSQTRDQPANPRPPRGQRHKRSDGYKKYCTIDPAGAGEQREGERSDAGAGENRYGERPARVFVERLWNKDGTDSDPCANCEPCQDSGKRANEDRVQLAQSADQGRSRFQIDVASSSSGSTGSGISLRRSRSGLPVIKAWSWDIPPRLSSSAAASLTVHLPREW